MTSEDLLTTGKIADIASVDRSAVHRWVDEGKLVPVHTLDSGIRLFARADVERFLAERAKTGPAQARAALAAARAKAAAK